MLADLYIYLGIALAGLLSFLSPCVLPLVPIPPLLLKPATASWNSRAGFTDRQWTAIGAGRIDAS